MLIFRSAQENIYANSIEYRQSKIKQNVTHDNVLYNQKIVYKKELNVIYRIGIGVLAFLGYATVVPYCLYSKKIALWWKQAVKGVDKKIVLILNGTSKKSVRFNDNVQIILFKKDNLSKIKSDEIRSNNAIPKESNHLIIPHTTVEPIIQMAPFLNFIQDISTKYSEMKRRLVDAVQSGDVKCTFDDQAYSFTFYHSPEEIKAIIKKYSLEEVSGNVSFDPNSCATMRGEAFIQMNSKQPKTKESLIKDSRLFFKTRQIQNIEIEKEDQSQNPEEMFAKLLKKNNGICIGEMHHDEAPK